MLNKTLRFPIAILFIVFEIVVFTEDRNTYPVNEDNKHCFKNPY